MVPGVIVVGKPAIIAGKIGRLVVVQKDARKFTWGDLFFSGEPNRGSTIISSHQSRTQGHQRAGGNRFSGETRQQGLRLLWRCYSSLSLTKMVGRVREDRSNGVTAKGR